jgi:hypothetical protein
LKFKNFKLCVAQLTQGGQVQRHGLDGPIGVGIVGTTLRR